MATLKYADKPWFQHEMLVNDYALPLASENEILIEKTPFYSQEDFDQQIRVASRLKAMKIRVLFRLNLKPRFNHKPNFKPNSQLSRSPSPKPNLTRDLILILTLNLSLNLTLNLTLNLALNLT